MKTVLKIIAVYQILVWGSAVWDYLILIYKIFENNRVSWFLTIIFLLTAIFIFCLYTNVCLLLGLKSEKKYVFLRFNILINLIQAVRIVLFGLTFYMEFGIYFLVYYYAEDQGYFAGRFSFFESTVGMRVSTASENIELGINVLPLIIAIILNQVVKKFRSEDMSKQIALIGSSHD